MTTISEDNQDRIWIGTWGKGIFILHKKDGSIKNISHSSSNKNSLSFNRITKILKDSTENMWIATFGGGLNKVSKLPVRNSFDEISFTHYKKHAGSGSSLGDDKVISLFQGKQGSIWIGTYYGGLNLIEKNYLKSLNINFPKIKVSPAQKNNTADYSIMAITEDDSGAIWLGTFGNGLIKYDPLQKSFRSFIHDEFSENSIADNDIISLFKDRAGILWVGSHLGQGVSRLERKLTKFNILKSGSTIGSSLNDDVVWSVYKDRNENLWVGTYRGGLNHYDARTKKFSYYKNNPADISSISGNHIRSIIEDRFGNVWVGTYSNGLNKFLVDQNKFIRFVHSDLDSFSIAGNQIQHLFIDSDSLLWIGVFGGGLNLLNLNGNTTSNPQFIKYKNEPSNPYSLSDDRVYTIYEDRGKNLWVGTFGGGLNRFDRATKKFERFRYDAQNPSSL